MSARLEVISRPVIMAGMLREYHASHPAFDCLSRQFKLPVFQFCNILKMLFVHLDLLEMFRLSFSRNGGLPVLQRPEDAVRSFGSVGGVSPLFLSERRSSCSATSWRCCSFVWICWRCFASLSLENGGLPSVVLSFCARPFDLPILPHLNL
jgi:hypothetical protein